MKKWYKGTTGNHWPSEGTFDIACCDEVETKIRHSEVNDTNVKHIQQDKHTKEREVLGWFRQEGNRRQKIHRAKRC